MTDIPLTGNIKNVSLSKILTYLNRTRKTGILSLKTLTFEKKIYLEKGDAIFASSTYEDDRLGEMLIKAGKINMEQYDKSVVILKQTKKRLGAILVELEYLNPKDLFWGVKYQVREIIYSLFLIEEAEYEFIEGDLPTNEVITLNMSMGNLIYEGVKRIENWTRIRREMPSTDIVLKLSMNPANLFQDVELSQQDRKMLSLTDGVRTIKEIIDNSWIGSFEAMKILYVLWSIGVLEETSPLPEKAEPIEESVSLDEVLQPFSEDEDTFWKKVDEIYSNLNKLSPYELLETENNSDLELIKKNYYRLSREYHPDRYFASEDPSLKDKLTAIFDAITNAYTLLKSKPSVEAKPEPPVKAKPQPPEKVKPAKPPAKKEQISPVKDGKEFFKRGVDEFKKGNFTLAVESFKSASELEPENASYWSNLSLSLTKVPNSLNDAVKALSNAIKLDPNNADYHTNLGFLYIKQGMNKMAQASFNKALKINPGHVKAKKGLSKI